MPTPPQEILGKNRERKKDVGSAKEVKEPLAERVKTAAETSPEASITYLRDILLPDKAEGLQDLQDDEKLVPRDRAIVDTSLARVEGCEKVLAV
jgi:hypothetical protein